MDLNFSDFDRPIRMDHSYSRFSRWEEQSSRRDRQVTFATFDLQSDLDIGTREEITCFVWHFQFSQQSFGRRVNRPRRPYNLRRKLSSCYLSDCKVGFRAYFDKFREGFRYVDVHTERRNSCHPKKLRSRAQGDERTNIRISRRHDSVERSPDDLERFEGLQPVHVCLVCNDGTLILSIVVRCSV